MLDSVDDYRRLLRKLSEEKDDQKAIALYRHLCRTDLFFLLVFVLKRHDALHPWILERCKEVQDSPDDCLDLWARGHYKSTIITLAKTIQDILCSHGDDADTKEYPHEVTFGIFSFIRPIAKQFLLQIMREFESNELLKSLFPDILYENPRRTSPKWSENEGIIVKRKGNPKECTIEAWGLVDGQPTSKHFTHLVYDDVVTIDSIRTPMMMDKVLTSWQMSLNLMGKGGKKRLIGTRYHFNDLYKYVIDLKDIHVRQHPCTDDGTIEGKPVLLTREDIEKKRKIQGAFTFSSQMLMNPLADEVDAFHIDWPQRYEKLHANTLNRYIVVDPANSKKASADYTAIWVVGLGSDENVYILDAYRDRLSLTERTSLLFELVKKWRPLRIGYERYGMQADIQHIKYVQAQEMFYFTITELGGKMAKIERIKRLIPLFQARRFFFPKDLRKRCADGITRCMVKTFFDEEYSFFPVPAHDDMLDSLSRLLDDELNIVYPRNEFSGFMDKLSTDTRSQTGWTA